MTYIYGFMTRKYGYSILKLVLFQTSDCSWRVKMIKLGKHGRRPLEQLVLKGHL